MTPKQSWKLKDTTDPHRLYDHTKDEYYPLRHFETQTIMKDPGHLQTIMKDPAPPTPPQKKKKKKKRSFETFWKQEITAHNLDNLYLGTLLGRHP